MKTILVYSGGLDSTVLLYYLIRQKHYIKCLLINYGQKHQKELISARYFCQKLNIQYKLIDLLEIKSLFSMSSLISTKSIPEGPYKRGKMQSTIVPNRNMIMLSIATAWAINEKFDNVAYAAHKNDCVVYPDCRKKFINSLSNTIKLADWHSVKIICPFINKLKKDIVKLGKKLNIEMEKTWSCYKGQKKHCGKCSTCIERIKAFRLVNVTDLTEYEK